MRWLAVIACAARVAAADPARARVITAPTAWLPGDGDIVATGGLDHRFDLSDGSIAVTYGLGGLASIEVGEDNDARACAAGTTCDTDHPPAAMRLGRAAFRIGARQDAWFHGQPAVALGVRASFASARTSGFDGAHVVEAYAVASRALAFIHVHAGVIALDAQAAGMPRMGTVVRPLVGLELTPPQYPKSTIVGDVGWSPLFSTAPRAELVGAVGFRYQAFAWGAIELDVRFRDGEGLAATTVMVRATGVLAR